MEEVTIQQCFDEMEQIITRMESNEIPLEESFELYQKGMEQLKLCNEKLNQVEKKVLQLNENGQLIPFEEE